MGSKRVAAARVTGLSNITCTEVQVKPILLDGSWRNRECVSALLEVDVAKAGPAFANHVVVSARSAVDPRRRHHRQLDAFVEGNRVAEQQAEAGSLQGS
ncbi:MAG TPA: hypothetical protein VIW27_03495 [Gammaproteobacteria bacterium]|jgi:hypothetical protein